MLPDPRMPFRTCLLALSVSMLAAVAPAHRAQDFLNAQDFQSAPPKLQGLVESWISWLGYGEYDRTGGQPFAGAKPPGLPADVTDITMQIKSGRYTKSNGCVYYWKEVFVWIKFDDGSSFVWWHVHTELTCPDGSVEVFDNVIASAGVEDPVTGAWSGWVRSYSRENLEVRRRASVRGTAGAVVELGSLASLPRPLVGPDTDDVDITIAPGGVLDLRGLDPSAGPLFETTGPVLIKCDQVLMDPGVQPADFFSPPPIVLPSAVVREIPVLGRAWDFVDAGAGSLDLRVMNLGNQVEDATFDWIDVMSWSFGGPAFGHLAPFDAPFTIALSTQVPPSAPPRTESDLQIQVQAGQYLQYDGMALVRAEDPPPVSQTYCTAKQNSLGCIPSIGTSGRASLSGYDDFVIHASDVLPNKHGIAFYGFEAAQVPFQGGTLCVRPPLVRTPVRTATRMNSGATCDGMYQLHLTQALMEARGLTPGVIAFAQWWSRDPQAPFGTGLTDAVSFVVGP